MSSQQNELDLVDVRDMWGHEALHFTPWLAENLNLLGKELSLNLVIDQTEFQIGPYYLDILAIEVDSGVKVAIENQLEETNLGHLGQLLTYATGCDAGVAIWVAPYFGIEFARALHKLNQWTGARVRFYGVKVEVYKRASDSLLVPCLRKVVFPGGWNKDLTLKRGSMPPTKQKFHDFFLPLERELTKTNCFRKPVLLFGHSGRLFRTRFGKGIGYGVSLEEGNSAWVTLHIGTGDKDLSNRLFDQLYDSKDDIESAIGVEDRLDWHWNKHPKFTFSSVNIKSEGSIDDSEDKQCITRKWMSSYLIRFRECFDSRLEEIVSDL